MGILPPIMDNQIEKYMKHEVEATKLLFRGLKATKPNQTEISASSLRPWMTERLLPIASTGHITCNAPSSASSPSCLPCGPCFC